MNIDQFQKLINSWYREYRRDLPWRNTFDAYSILVSEIMLQQTQVSRVLNYYDKFLKTYPTFSALATADNKTLFDLWSGLGYWKRALNLKKIAEIVEEKYEGVLPREINILKTLPGIGEYTSAALLCFIYNYPVAFIETNIRKVIKHFFFKDEEFVSDKEIYKIAELTLDRNNPREWNYALMDYGSSQFKKNNTGKTFKRESFANSNRYYRGELIRFINLNGEVSISEIRKLLNNMSQDKITNSRLNIILDSLVKDELIINRGESYFI